MQDSVKPQLWTAVNVTETTLFSFLYFLFTLTHDGLSLGRLEKTHLGKEVLKACGQR